MQEDRRQMQQLLFSLLGQTIWQKALKGQRAHFGSQFIEFEDFVHHEEEGMVAGSPTGAGGYS